MAGADQDTDQAELRFHELYRANFRPVQGYAVNRLGAADDVLDVVAEVFTIAWRRLADIPPPPADRFWLYGTARRVIARRHRSAGRLRAAGVPANVRFTHHFFQPSTSTLPKGCLAPRMPHQASIKLLERIEADNVPYVPSGVAVLLRPSVIPHGLGLYLKAWAPKPGTQSFASLSIQTDLVQATPQCTG